MISIRSAITLAALAVCFGLPACAGGPGPREQRLSDGFAAIQIEEARIAEARGRAGTGAECKPGCEARRETCDAGKRLCELAEQLEDADALGRCAQARNQCHRAAPDCAC